MTYYQPQNHCEMNGYSDFQSCYSSGNGVYATNNGGEVCYTYTNTANLPSFKPNDSYPSTPSYTSNSRPFNPAPGAPVRLRNTEPAPQPVGTPDAWNKLMQDVYQDQGNPSKMPSKHVLHDIQRWIDSVESSLRVTGPGLPQSDVPRGVLLERATLLNFLNNMKMWHIKRLEQRIHLCVFCRQNQEPFEMYSSHRIKDAKGAVTCPVLYRYTCPICGASGSTAHTIKYCPKGSTQVKVAGECPTTGSACYKSQRNATGRFRRA